MKSKILNTLAFCIPDSKIREIANKNPKLAEMILEEQGRGL